MRIKSGLIPLVNRSIDQIVDDQILHPHHQVQVAEPDIAIHGDYDVDGITSVALLAGSLSVSACATSEFAKKQGIYHYQMGVSYFNENNMAAVKPR